MKTLIAAALAVAGMMGTALAEDTMAPTSRDTMMTPNQMMEACLKNAGMLDGMAAQEAGKKTCNDAFALAMGNMGAMGTPMGGDAMASMSGDAMAPTPAGGMAADPGAMAPAQ